MQQQEVCPDKEHAGGRDKPRMSQVPFVAICSGHLDDFPFDKWVHRPQPELHWRAPPVLTWRRRP